MKALLPTTLLALILTVATGASKKETVEARHEVPPATVQPAAPAADRSWQAAPGTVTAPDDLHAG